MSDAGTTRQNPYVGPRSFQEGETLYGRDREAAELQDLVIAERIVLLYSPSGAGKTSLLQAKLLPALQSAGFAVRSIRPGAEPSAPSANRFLRATLDSLGAGAQETSLPRYLGKPAGPELLVFDQFEEVLNIDAGDRDAKSAFFTQLGEALRPRGRWALFSMREDYIAGLDPYLKLIPTRFAATYRLDLLDRERAIHAIRNPALAAGVDFTEAAAGRLADDLRRDSPYIEPVQLQVVCLRLWDRQRPNPAQVTEADLGGAGDIDQALAQYYADCVTATASAGSPGRAIRDWFDRRLISKQGTRTQVLRGPDQGLDNDTIAALVNLHLIRGDQRNSATWYELAHDRLIAPIRENNRAWREANLSPLQRQAELWEEQRRPDGALLSGAALAKAEAWARTNSHLDPVESDFLSACRAQRRRQYLQRAGVAVIAALAIAALFAFFKANRETRRADSNAADANAAADLARRKTGDATKAQQQAEQNRSDATKAAERATTAESNAIDQARLATAGRLASSAVLEKDRQTALAGLLAIEAFHRDANYDSRDALLLTAQSNPRLLRFLRNPADAHATVFDPKGRYLVTAGAPGLIQFWDPQTGRKIRDFPAAIDGHSAPVSNLAISPDGQLLAAVLPQGVGLWDIAAGAKFVSLLPGKLTSVAFSRNGKMLAVGGFSPGYQLWDLVTGAPPKLHPLRSGAAGSGRAYSVAFFSNDRQLAVTQGISYATVYDIETETGMMSPLGAEFGAYLRVGLAGTQPAGLLEKKVVVGTSDSTVADYLPNGPQRLTEFVGIAPGQSAAGKKTPFQIAAIGDDNAVTIWQSPNQAQTLRSGAEPLYSLTYSPELNLLATSGGAVWDVGQAASMAAAPHPLPGVKSARDVAFSADGKSLLIGTVSQHPEIWDVSRRIKIRELGGTVTMKSLFDAPFPYVAYGGSWAPDGGLLATAGAPDQLISFWNPKTGAQAGQLPAGAANIAFLSQAMLAAGQLDPHGSFLQIWDVKKRTPVGDPLYRIGALFSPRVAVSADGKLIAAGFQREVRVWRVATRTLLAVHRSEADVNGLAFNPQGDRIAIASGDQVDICETGAESSRSGANPERAARVLLRIAGHTGVIQDVAYNSTGEILATAGEDGDVRLWSQDGTPLGEPVLHSSKPIVRIAFSANSSSTLAAASDEGVFLVDTSAEAQAQRNCGRANRNLTFAEWKRYLGNEEYRKTCPNLPAGEGASAK